MSSTQEQCVRHRPWTPESEREYTGHAIERAPAACQGALREYARWLEENRDLRPGSVTLRVASARSFVGAVTTGGATVAAAFGTLAARGVEEFFVSYWRDHGPSFPRKACPRQGVGRESIRSNAKRFPPGSPLPRG
jgi:hypothetical protein